jgi:hypothetical protein
VRIENQRIEVMDGINDAQVRIKRTILIDIFSALVLKVSSLYLICAVGVFT